MIGRPNSVYESKVKARLAKLNTRDKLQALLTAWRYLSKSGLIGVRFLSTDVSQNRVDKQYASLCEETGILLDRLNASKKKRHSRKPAR